MADVKQSFKKALDGVKIKVKIKAKIPMAPKAPMVKPMRETEAPNG